MSKQTKEEIAEGVLELLKAFKGGDRKEARRWKLRHLCFIQTWGDLKNFIECEGDWDVRDFMLYPICIIENINKEAILLSGKPNWKVVNRFKKDFTQDDGAFRWPITDETVLTKRHVGAIRRICTHPDYGRRLWNSHALFSLIYEKGDAAHITAMTFFRSLYFLLEE